MNYLTLTPGSVIIQRPLHQVFWCLQSGKWPKWISFAHAILSLIIALLQKGEHGSHVVLYIGHGQFMHTTLGKVVLWHEADFPPGYLETSLILRPSSEKLWKINKTEEIKKKWIGASISIPGFLSTAFIRWRLLHWSSSRLHNCTHLLYVLWLENTGVDLAKEIGVDPRGIFPTDFLRMSERFIHVQTSKN